MFAFVCPLSPFISENSTSQINIHAPQVFLLLSLALATFCLWTLLLLCNSSGSGPGISARALPSAQHQLRPRFVVRRAVRQVGKRVPRVPPSCGTRRGWSCDISGTECVCVLGSGRGRVAGEVLQHACHLGRLGRAPPWLGV